VASKNFHLFVVQVQCSPPLISYPPSFTPIPSGGVCEGVNEKDLVDFLMLREDLLSLPSVWRLALFEANHLFLGV